MRKLRLQFPLTVKRINKFRNKKGKLKMLTAFLHKDQDLISVGREEES